MLVKNKDNEFCEFNGEMSKANGKNMVTALLLIYNRFNAIKRKFLFVIMY